MTKLEERRRARHWKAFLCYAPKRHGLDSNSATKRPQEQHIVLLNHDKLEIASFAAETENHIMGLSPPQGNL
jgi:hypothetical protein